MFEINELINGKVDYSNKKRIDFIRQMAAAMSDFNSSNKEVNNLINLMFAKSEKVPYVEDTYDCRKIKLKDVEKINDDIVIKEVHKADLYLFAYASLLHEYIGWNSKDVLTDIISTIYFKLDEILHPYLETDRDMIDSRYYIELEYEKEEAK